MKSLIKRKSKPITIILIYLMGLIIPSFSLPIQTSITYTEIQWSTPELISDQGQICHNPSILIDESNAIYVAWPGSRFTDYDMYINYRSLPFNSSTWTDILDVSNAAGAFGTPEICSIIQDQKNYTHICWLASLGQLYYRYFNGISWSELQLVSEISQYDLFSFSSFSDGSIIFVWSKLKDSTTQLFSKCYNPLFNNWSSEHQVINTPYNSIKPNLVVDSNDLVHLIWLEEFEFLSNTSVYYKSFNRDYEISSETKISAQCNTLTDARIVVDNYNNLHAIWEEKDGYTFKLAYRKQVDNIWLSKIFINPYYADNPAIFYDSNNITHFIWYEGNSLMYRTINQSMQLSEIESAVEFCGGTHPELVVDSYGNVHVIYLADPLEYTVASPPTEFGINYIVRKKITLTTEPTTIAVTIPLTAFIIIIYFGFSAIIIVNRKFRKKELWEKITRN
ncbi:MAG: hypothetical protein FK730_13840 [Asgard group archaeon]|nr:hypothetical protein [Asgard group archaeon]